MRAIVIGFGLLLAGCATSFTGDAHYPGGPGACFRDCQEQRMVMAAYVHMGEYSTGCVCAPAQGGTASGSDAVAAAVPAAVGVVLQMRAEAERQAVLAR